MAAEVKKATASATRRARESDVESSRTSLELPSAVYASPAHGGHWPRSLYLSRVGLKAFAGANGFEKRAS